MSSSNPISVFDRLQKFGNYIISLALLCYLAGFAVTNIYLGSLGVVNLDMLRARYMLAGLLFLLFLLFVGAIIYLVYGLIHTLRKHQEQSWFQIVKSVSWYSFQQVGLLYIVMPALAVFAGSASSPPVGIPRLSPITPWSDWLNTAPLTALRGSVGILVAILVAVVVVVSAIVVINPRDKTGKREPRLHVLADMLKNIWRSKGKILGLAVAAFAFMYAILLLGSLLGFLASSKIGGQSTGTGLMLTEG